MRSGASARSRRPGCASAASRGWSTFEPSIQPCCATTVGSLADWLLQLAAGQDDRPVEPNRPSKSSSSECTYAHDLLDLERIREEVAHMARENAEWLEKHGLVARTVTIKVRYDDFTTITRSDTRPPTSDPDQIQERAVRLLAKTEAGRRPVRLLGAGVHNIGDLEEDEIKEEDPQGRLPF